jgi:hypothetical protein
LALSIAPKYVSSTLDLKIPWSYQNNVSYFDPDSSLHLPSNSTHSFVAVSTFDKEPVISEHLGHDAKKLTFARHHHLSKLAFA